MNKNNYNFDKSNPRHRKLYSEVSKCKPFDNMSNTGKIIDILIKNNYYGYALKFILYTCKNTVGASLDDFKSHLLKIYKFYIEKENVLSFSFKFKLNELNKRLKIIDHEFSLEKELKELELIKK